jgi:hypothetical protein
VSDSAGRAVKAFEKCSVICVRNRSLVGEISLFITRVLSLVLAIHFKIIHFCGNFAGIIRNFLLMQRVLWLYLSAGAASLEREDANECCDGYNS